MGDDSDETDTVRHLQEKLEEQHMARIATLEAEKARLWDELHAKQATLDALTLGMLPAPIPPEESRLMRWIIGVLFVVIAAF